jgi:spoIIIJ-associated protein
MDMITVTAKTLDEAITKALIELGTTSDNLDYTVIEKGSSGLFGLFSKNVVINARRKREDDFDDILASIKCGNKENKVSADPLKEKKEVKESKEEKESPKKEFRKDQKKDRTEQRTENRQRTEAKPKSENRQRFDSKAENKHETKRTEVHQEPVQQPVNPAFEAKEEKKSEKKPVDVAVCEKAAKEFLSHVFAAMGMNVILEASYDESEKELTVNMSGDDMGILIGKRGQTLDSLQYLVSLVVNKECDGYLRVKLDTENYRARRKETLESLAKNIAYKVKRTRRSVSLEPMNPYERRIIHAALQNDKYVVTRSEGEDPFRHVVISLKRDNREYRENRGNRNNQQSEQQS